MPGVAAEWFPGAAWDEDGEVFLAELRRRVDARGLVDVRPEDTTLHAWSEGLVIVLIEAPGLLRTEEKPTLEVVARYGGDDPWLMTGWETHGHLTDSCDPMDLAGVEPRPGRWRAALSTGSRPSSVDRWRGPTGGAGGVGPRSSGTPTPVSRCGALCPAGAGAGSPTASYGCASRVSSPLAV